MNKNPVRVASLNENNYLEYTCQDSSSSCTAIVQNEDEVQVIFTNGRELETRLFTIIVKFCGHPSHLKSIFNLTLYCSRFHLWSSDIKINFVLF
jgi:hypothetical protein